MVHAMSQTVAQGTPHAIVLAQIAVKCFRFLSQHGGSFECMKAIENGIGVPRVRPEFIRFWFGRLKGFPHTETVADIVERGAVVPVCGSAEIAAALSYGNHRSVVPYSDTILRKVFDDVRFGRAFVFPKTEAELIPGLRLSPLGVVVPPEKIRIIHDLTFECSPVSRSVNADTDSEVAPKVELGHVLRDIVWRILWLRRTYGPSARIVLSKIDVTDAFRQVAVQWSGAPVFGYSVGDLVVVDRRLVFGWRNSPGNFCVMTAALEHSHNHTSVANAVVTDLGRTATNHVEVPLPSERETPPPFPPGCRIPPGSGGGRSDSFFVRFYVDDGILVEVMWSPTGDRCKIASASCASDHFRIFGARGSRDPPLLSARKLSSWCTRLCVLGWDIDTVDMTISVPTDKRERLRATINEWPTTRCFASESELRGVIGSFLHICEVVRPGKYFVRRMLNQLGLPPVQVTAQGATRKRIGPEFHADMRFWRLLVDGGLGSPSRLLTAPLVCFFDQPYSCLLWSDASGDAMGGYFLHAEFRSGVWWRFDFSPEVRERFRQQAQGRDDLSINMLELLAMVVGAWVFIVQSEMRLEYARNSIRMMGDNSSSVAWVNKCRGGSEPRSGAIMRMLGCLEMGSGWCFEAAHVRGVDNTIADGISRWEPATIDARLRLSRPNVAWRQQVLSPEVADLCTGVLAASTSASQLRSRLEELTCRVGGLGVIFAA